MTEFILFPPENVSRAFDASDALVLLDDCCARSWPPGLRRRLLRKMALPDGRRGPPPDKVVVVGRGGRRDVGVVDDDDGDDDDEAGSGKGAGSDNDDDKVATAVLRRAGGQNGNQASAVVRKMERGISRATDNEVIVNKARDRVEQNFSAAMRISDSPDSRGFTGAKPNGPQVGGPGRLPEEDDDVEDVPFAAGAGPAAAAGPARRKTALSTTTTTAKAKAVGFTAARGKPSTASATSGFIETPTFTFTLPDLTCYQGYYYIILIIIIIIIIIICRFYRPFSSRFLHFNLLFIFLEDAQFRKLQTQSA